MELIKNIFFNTDKLVENATVKMSYTGMFFEDNSEKVFLHYGFGNSWSNLSEIEMEKTDLGYQATINLVSAEDFNFCFKNDKNVWDNNNGQNYSFHVEKDETIIDDDREPVEDNLSAALIVAEENSLFTPRKLKRSYFWSKRAKLAVYKIITYIPKLFSGNYKRKLTDNFE